MPWRWGRVGGWRVVAGRVASGRGCAARAGRRAGVATGDGLQLQVAPLLAGLQVSAVGAGLQVASRAAGRGGRRRRGRARAWAAGRPPRGRRRRVVPSPAWPTPTETARSSRPCQPSPRRRRPRSSCGAAGSGARARCCRWPLARRGRYRCRSPAMAAPSRPRPRESGRWPRGVRSTGRRATVVSGGGHGHRVSPLPHLGAAPPGLALGRPLWRRGRARAACRPPPAPPLGLPRRGASPAGPEGRGARQGRVGRDGRRRASRRAGGRGGEATGEGEADEGGAVQASMTRTLRSARVPASVRARIASSASGREG